MLYTKQQLKAAAAWLNEFNQAKEIDPSIKMSEYNSYKHYKKICSLIAKEHALSDWSDVNTFLLTGSLPESEDEFLKKYA